MLRHHDVRRDSVFYFLKEKYVNIIKEVTYMREWL